jgi:DNA-binding response OmpR family regulator
MRVLVVDDEKALVKGIKFNLEMDGFEVATAYDGEEAVEKVRAGGIDLIIMDLMMPKKNGLDACLEIRSFSKLPIIMLTAKSEDNDKIIGFEYGADDYVTKPFNILELKARVRALLRRSAPAEASSAPSSVLVSGPFRLDTESRVAFRDGQEIELTAREFDVVELLMRNPGKVFSRDALLKLVWGADYQGDIRTVDVHIRRIREKMEADPAEPVKIMTKWGVGYYLKA